MSITVSLNVGSIRAKLRNWADSGAGKQKMADKIAEYIESDVRETQAGSRVITLGWVDELAAELANMISAGSPAAISFDVGGGGAVHIGGGAIMASLTISGNLSRPSLYPEKYGGANNIVVLFEKGWSAGGKVWGFWNGDYTWSRMSYEGDHFIADAVARFNAMYSGLGITATVMGDYA